jgi:hypothetical protein
MCRGLFEKLLAVGQTVPEKTEKTVFSFLKERNTVGLWLTYDTVSYLLFLIGNDLKLMTGNMAHIDIADDTK